MNKELCNIMQKVALHELLIFKIFFVRHNEIFKFFKLNFIILKNFESPHYLHRELDKDENSFLNMTFS
jgi:hypothetical protein